MIFDPGFSTPEMTRIFAPESRLALFCRFEAELAGAQGELGLVPPEAAAEIARVCSQPIGDPRAMVTAGWEVGTPVLPLLEDLRSRLGNGAGRWLHHGATSQDVVDTAMVLQVKAALGVIDVSVSGVASLLAQLADAHRATVMMGRTLLQDAVPTTFGSKAALWLEPLLRHRLYLGPATARLPVQLGGPVGDAASFGALRFELAELLAGRLGLVAPITPWHTDRAPITETVALAGRVAASMAKIGTDVGLLAQTAIGEVRVRPGLSSAMTHKRNPIDSVGAVAAARVCQAMTAGVTGGPPYELERSLGAWQAESVMVPIVFQTAAASVAAISRCLEGIEVDIDRMAHNAGNAAVGDSRLIDRVLATHRGREPLR